MSESRSKVCSCQMSLTPESNLGGGVFHYHCLRALADQGVPCLIPLAFNTAHEPRPNWDVRALPFRRTFKLGALFSNAVFFAHLFWLWFVKKERFDLLRVSDPYYVGPAAWLFAGLTRVPTLGYVFHIDRGVAFRNRVIGWVCRRLDAVVVTSKFSKNQVCTRFGLAQDSVFVTYGGVTRFDANLSKEDAKRSLGVEGKTVLAFLGSLTERKNPEGLLEIFHRVAKKSPGAVLMICGSEPKPEGLTQRLKQKSESLGLSDRVVFTGWIDNAKKAQIYRAADLFVFPSHLEGFGLAVVEAMIQGVPAVVSDRGSLPEIVQDAQTGFVRDPDDPEGFADAVLDLVTDSKTREQMGRRAATQVAQRFGWNRCAEETIKIHDHLVAKSRRTRLGVLLNTGDSLTVMEKEGQKDRFVKSYLARWSQTFDRVEVFSYGDDRERMDEGIRFHPNRRARKGLLYSLMLPFLYRKTFLQCSLLRVMQTQGALPATIACALYRIPFVTTYGYRYGDSMRLKGRPVYGLWLDLLERVALRFASAVIVTTPSLHRHVQRFVKNERIHFIPNGVDIRRFFPEVSKEQSRLRVLFVGRLEPHKNLDMVIEALWPVTHVPVELWVVGEGPEKNRWESMCREKNLKARFFGSVPHSNLPAIHRQAEIFVLPSRFEGHPKALIEAFASGLPCIGARAPGISDVIEDGRTGLLAELTVSSFAEQLVRLLSDKDLRDQLGQAARAVAVEKYDLAQILDREMELVKSIASGKSG